MRKKLIKIDKYLKASAAIGLWNNLHQPIGKKQTASSAYEPLICPSKGHPYFYTAKN